MEDEELEACDNEAERDFANDEEDAYWEDREDDDYEEYEDEFPLDLDDLE